MADLTLDSPGVKELFAAELAKVKTEAEENTKKVTEGLLKKRDTLLEEVVGLKGKLKGYDPERIIVLEKLEKDLEAQKHQKDIDDGSMESVVQRYETRISEIMKTKDEEVTAAKAETEKLLDSYTKTITENNVLDALAKRKVPPEVMLNNIKPFTQSVVGEDGKFTTIVTDANGNQRFDPKTNEPVTVLGLLDEMALQPAFAPNFPQSSGSGAGNGKEFSGAIGVTKLSDLKTSDDKIAYQKKHGLEAMNKLTMDNK